MERLTYIYACDFFKSKCRRLAFTVLGFRHQMHARFLSRTAFRATPCTVISNRFEGRKQQCHTPLTSLLCCRNKVTFLV